MSKLLALAIAALVAWGLSGVGHAVSSVLAAAQQVSADESLRGAGELIFIAGRPLTIVELEAEDPHLVAALPALAVSVDPTRASETLATPVGADCDYAAVVFGPWAQGTALPPFPGVWWASRPGGAALCQASALPAGVHWVSSPLGG